MHQVLHLFLSAQMGSHLPYGLRRAMKPAMGGGQCCTCKHWDLFEAREDLRAHVTGLPCYRAQIFVFFPEEDKVGVKTIKTFAERMRNEGVARAVMVTQANMTPFARQCLAEMAPKYYIEVVRHSTCS